jgi:hypothetical protein
MTYSLFLDNEKRFQPSPYNKYMTVITTRQTKLQKIDKVALLSSGTVEMGCKSLWPQASGPSLLKCRYSGSSVATDMLTSFAGRYSSPQ